MPEPLTSTLLELVEKLEMIGLKRKEFTAAVRDDSDSDYTDSEDTECELEKCSPDEQDVYELLESGVHTVEGHSVGVIPDEQDVYELLEGGAHTVEGHSVGVTADGFYYIL